MPPAAAPAGQTTRTTGTETFYQDQVRRLAVAYWCSRNKQRRAPPDVVEGIVQDPAFVTWLIEEKSKGLSKPTWRVYRAAVRFAIARSGSPGATGLLQQLQDAGAAGATITTSRTRRKKKSLPAGDEALLTKWMAERTDATRRGGYAALAIVWLRATRLVGLRPIEWRSAQLVRSTVVVDADRPAERRAILVVQSAKATNGRGLGGSRKLDLVELSEEEQAIVEQMTLAAYQLVQEGHFSAAYRACSELLREANAALWPKRKQRITLYSGRHQVSADGKNRFSAAELASVMGHSSDLTAQIHYGKRRKGSATRMPLPDQAIVGQVRLKSEEKAARAAANTTVRARQRRPPQDRPN